MSDGGPAAAPAGWPSPDDRPCDGCGHVWFAGERPHHYVASGAARAADAEVLCALCRHQRGLATPRSP